MKKMRFLAVLLGLLMMFSTPASVLAEQDDYSTGRDYQQDQGQQIYSYDIENQAMIEQQYFETWNNAIILNQLPDLSQYDVTDETELSNNGQVENRVTGNAPQDVTVQIVSQDEVTPTPTPYVVYNPQDDNPRGPVNPDWDEPTPTEDPRGHANPDDEPTATPEPVQVVSTPIPTPPVLVQYLPPQQEVVQALTVVEEPTKVVYDVDLEVGRLAHFVPTQLTNTTKKSSNTKIINDPRSATGSFSANEYEARANNPGDATITFYNQTKNFTEEYNVHVYCRPLDFDKTQYVVQSSETKATYLTLYLKYFEYQFEYAYDFKWSSSNTKVAYTAGADSLGTYARVCIPKGAEGATVFTVSDKYGNSSSAVIIVKSSKPVAADNKKDADKDKGTSDTGKSDSTDSKETDTTDISKLTAKQLKALIKKIDVDLTLTGNKKGKMTVKWSDDSDVELDGYQVYVSTNGKKFKLKYDTEDGEVLKYTYKKAKKGKTYYFKVRGYKKNGDSAYYTDWSDVITAVYKK